MRDQIDKVIDEEHQFGQGFDKRSEVDANIRLEDLFYRLGRATPSPLYIGSRRSEEFRNVCVKYPTQFFNPEGYGIGSANSPNVKYYMKSEGLNGLNSNFVAGFLENGGSVECKAFLGSYVHKIQALGFRDPHNAKRTFGTLGEIGMLLRHGCSLATYFERNLSDTDVGNVCRAISDVQAKARKMSALKKSLVYRTRFMFVPNRVPQLATRDFLSERDLLELLKNEGLAEFSSLQYEEVRTGLTRSQR